MTLQSFSNVLVLCQVRHDLSAGCLFNASSSRPLRRRVRVGSSPPLPNPSLPTPLSPVCHLSWDCSPIFYIYCFFACVRCSRHSYLPIWLRGPTSSSPVTSSTFSFSHVLRRASQPHLESRQIKVWACGLLDVRTRQVSKQGRNRGFSRASHHFLEPSKMRVAQVGAISDITTRFADQSKTTVELSQCSNQGFLPRLSALRQDNHPCRFGRPAARLSDRDLHMSALSPDPCQPRRNFPGHRLIWALGPMASPSRANAAPVISTDFPMLRKCLRPSSRTPCQPGDPC